MLELFKYDFFMHALLACVFGGGGLAMTGVCVTLMEMPFLGITMAHSAFLGAVAGLLFGFNPLACALAACAVSGFAIGPMADKSGASSNSMLAVFFSATMGLAFLLLSRISGPKSEALNLMWGSILTISRPEIIVLGCVFTLALALLIIFYKEIVAVIFNREIAAASGVPEKIFFYSMIFVTGMLVSSSLNIVGGLLIFSLLVNPSGAAYQLTYRMKLMFALSALFGICSCVAGLVVSFWLDVPTGAVIVLSSSAIYLAAFLFSPKRKAVKIKQEKTS